MADDILTNAPGETLDAAVAEGGAYEVLKKRLTDLADDLRRKAETLNRDRLAEFGKSGMEILGRIRIRTENNCVARDIVRVGDMLLFGYNVFMGLKLETVVSDVFSLYTLTRGEDGEYEAAAAPLEGTFLDDKAFRRDFAELYTYYKGARLLMLREHNDKLLAAFQIGDRVSDLRVFRWSVAPGNGKIAYIDNRGERDLSMPPAHDFEWIPTGREQQVNGRHPHINILDTVFVETVGGDLTIKLENNTEDGLGIYREDVLDKNQSLDDAQILYARIGSLILLKILPYRETDWRYFVFNSLTKDVRRIDAIGKACAQLPEDHGIIFPGGYYLQNSDYKLYDQTAADMLLRRIRRSPNGEDVLYVFYEPVEGRCALFNYNLIERKLDNPLLGNGHALYEDGPMILFEDEQGEPTRVHPMQIWQTPYYSEEFAAQKRDSTTPLGRIGNADLVRGISDAYNIVRQIGAQTVSATLYEKLGKDTLRLFDAYFWMKDERFGLSPILRDIAKTAELVIDEYEKVESIRRQSMQDMRDARARQRELFDGLIPDSWSGTQEFADALNRINRQRGRIISLRGLRYIDTAEIDAMERELAEREVVISRATAEFLAGDKAMQPFEQTLAEVNAAGERAGTAAEMTASSERLASMTADLDMLSSLMSSLPFDDVPLQTRIIEGISDVYGKVNQARTRLEQKLRQMGSAEAEARFGAQFKLFSQSIANALSLASTPERCDEELSRLLLQLEDLESQFSDSERFMADILQKREELLEAFEKHKQGMLEERQRRCQALLLSAERILSTLTRRAAKCATADELNAFFVADPMARKVPELAGQLRALFDTVKADDVEARFKNLQDQALRSLRDKTELFEDGGATIKLGRHKFSVNTQELDLTLLPGENGLYFHLTGTDFSEKATAPELEDTGEFWPLTMESESPEVCRAEYLAYCIIDDASCNVDGFSFTQLTEMLSRPDDLEEYVKVYAAPRYREGYEKGIHDHDAYLILKEVLPISRQADLLRFAPAARALAMLFWHAKQNGAEEAAWPDWARSGHGVNRLFKSGTGLEELRKTMGAALTEYALYLGLTGRDDLQSDLPEQAAEFLSLTLARNPVEFPCGKYAKTLLLTLRDTMEKRHVWTDFARTQERLAAAPDQRLGLALTWLHGLASQQEYAHLAPYVPEAAALLMMETGPILAASAPDGQTPAVITRFSEVDLLATVKGMLSSHPSITNGSLTIVVDNFYSRLRRHRNHVIPGFKRFQAVRHAILERERADMRLSEFRPRPLSSFVRNRLIDQVYLPMVGDNLAKQIGVAGDAKRTDLMGMLMIISPPGYGKTTLMEYVAYSLGMIFMKINGPALGHSVISLDPANAPDATSAQELEKLNLALEMGNNVMLYVDDIQHTNPEFLQKFISLCDGTRRVEGVWKGRSRTYDMRGKKFCVVMAGNPYTESGEVFTIPDMLANRADVYNLGEVLGGMRDAFALSYIENSLTSNRVLAPLAQRDLSDLYHFVDMAEGKPSSAGDFSYNYSAAEKQEITEVLKRLVTIRDVLLSVNRQYIASASQADQYRTEPPFKLQGSYRSMNKLAEQVSAVMNESEIQRLIDDFYTGESQLLTDSAEENLLKLDELRDRLTPEKKERWEQIKRQFVRNKSFGGENSSVGDRVVAQLADLVICVNDLKDGVTGGNGRSGATDEQFKRLVEGVEKIGGSRTLQTSMHSLAQRMVLLAKGMLTLHSEKTAGMNEVLLGKLNGLLQEVQKMQKTLNGKK